MQSDSGTQSNWSQIDDNCAKSCTRSGVAALLLSAFAISMLPVLDKSESLNALLGYISSRITLKEEITRLSSDRAWNRLIEADPSAKSWDLAKIISYLEKPHAEVSSATVSPTVSPDNVAPGKPESRVPAAPTGLRVRVAGEPVFRIKETLEELADLDFLRRARKYTYRYDLSIYQWSLLLLRKVEEGTPTKSTTTPLSMLTLAQIEELANFNLPDISEVERLLKEASIPLPSVGMAASLPAATLFIEVALLLLTSYWWIWYREARRSPNFPAPGTLFGVLASSIPSRAIFSLLILLPPIAAALVAWRTLAFEYGYWNAIFAVLIVVVVSLIRWEGDLRPRD